MFDNANILITGGTGSFGSEFVRYKLLNYKPKRLIVFSRDEMKQWEMAKKFAKYKYNCLRFFIGDVREKDRLHRALINVDYVIHAAALKQVPTSDYNPFETIKTNILGTQNVVDACIDNNVEKLVALSTDKASSPINLYGATKLTSDKLFVAGNAYSGEHGTNFSVVRYGNVMGSRGSVIPFFKGLIDSGVAELPITDPNMTRFMITLDQGVELVWHAFADMVGGEIYVKKIPSMNIMDIAKAVSKNAATKIVGIRPGEKLHEQMIGLEDAPCTYEYEEHFKILPMINDWFNTHDRIKDGKSVRDDFVYSSDNNPEWMAIETLEQWVHEQF